MMMCLFDNLHYLHYLHYLLIIERLKAVLGQDTWILTSGRIRISSTIIKWRWWSLMVCLEHCTSIASRCCSTALCGPLYDVRWLLQSMTGKQPFFTINNSTRISYLFESIVVWYCFYWLSWWSDQLPVLGHDDNNQITFFFYGYFISPCSYCYLQRLFLDLE